MLEAILEIPHAGEHDECEESCKNRHAVHPEADRHADTRGNPETGRGCDAMQRIAPKNNEPSADESDGVHDKAGNLQGLKIYDAQIRAVDVRADDNKKARAERNKTKRARSRRLPRQDRPLGANDTAEEHRQEKLPE